MLNFQPIELKDKPVFDKYFRQRRYEGSENTFTNLFIWRECYKIQWAIVEDFLCIKPQLDNLHFVLPPYGLTDNGIERALNKLMDYFALNGFPFQMRGISPEMKGVLERIYPGKFSFKEERDVFDYVYLIEDLISLKGRKYHRKRNHLKKFKKMYPHYQYVPLTEELIKPCIINLKEWCLKKGCEEDKSLLCERDAIISAFENFSELDYIGGVILIDGNVEAFTFGEALNEDTVLIHAEKANVDITGIYQVINQEFLKNNWQHMKYVNREEDLGIEGLRKAKLSYFPVNLVIKYSAVLKNEVK
ncbi:MAG: uncharacterized protein PWQ67_660 [Clostridia bacterium]|jgi:hypothetical protein|nr:uncharacterized protein [Clostridia bacterium]MDN5322206.1 uncharacterized protein [Clostridia bacterium]